METLIFKIVLSSALLIAFYYLFLEKERSFKFNRSFLLSAVVFSYTVPFIPYNSPFKSYDNPQLIIGEGSLELNAASVNVAPSFDWMKILFIAYLLVSLFFLIKFIYSFLRLKFLKGEMRTHKNQKILILQKNYAPFSFLGTIYLSRKYLVDDQIDNRIFLHEKCHVEEKHSLDILFIEFLKIFSWFNPALFFYKKAMIANHEFLADQYVLQKNYDVKNYQYLILNEIKMAQSFNLTHQFDFNNTKKRFIMMTSKNSRFSGLKKFTLLPVLAVLFVLSAKKVSAQTESKPDVEPTPVKAEKQDVAILLDEKNATPDQKEFMAMAKKIMAEHQLKKDTINKKQSQDIAVPTPPPPPPPPGKFEQVPAEFPGGANALRQLVGNNFDTSILSSEQGLLKTTINLNIDENGNVSNVAAEGENQKFNAEAVRAFTTANEGKVWKPATENGQAVKSVYKVPLTMVFQGSAKK